MGLLIECPKCRMRNSPKAEKCNCGLALKKLGNKNYWIEFYDETGGRKRERIGPSKMAAEQRLRDVLKARTEERHIQKDLAARVTLGELCQWYEKLPEVKAKASYERDLDSIQNLKRLLGETTKIRELTAGLFEGYQTKRLTEPSRKPSEKPNQPATAHQIKTIRPATVNRELSCLKTMINRAIRHGKLNSNPIANVKSLPENNVRERVLTQDEFERLVDACENHLKPIVITAYYTAMRSSEILQLSWVEVDLQKNFIRLQGERTKTGVARSIPLHPRVREALLKLPRSIISNRVFLRRGNPIDEVKKSFRSACERAKIQDFRFHDLRHCAINNLRIAGNDFFKIMAVSGHKTMNVFKRYNLVTEAELSALSWHDRAQSSGG